MKVKNSVFQKIKEEFDKAGIEIPYPHVSVYKGEITDPFPVKIIPDHDKYTES